MTWRIFENVCTVNRELCLGAVADELREVCSLSVVQVVYFTIDHLYVSARYNCIRFFVIQGYID